MNGFFLYTFQNIVHILEQKKLATFGRGEGRVCMWLSTTGPIYDVLNIFSHNEDNYF